MMDAAPEPSIAKTQPLADGWMFATHYHCRDCGAEVTFWGRLPWITHMGVRSVGACRRCSLVMVEPENAEPVWIPIPYQ